MDVHDRRRERLRELLREITAAELARRSGVAPSLITRYLYEPGAKGAKNIGEENARKLEHGGGKGQGWLDKSPSSAGRENAMAQPTIQFARYPAATRRVEVPVRLTVRPAPSGELTVESEIVDGVVDVAHVGPNAFAVRINGDALYPAVKHGTYLVCDPDAAPVPGEPVLLTKTDGTVHLRELVFDKPSEITTLSLVGGHRETLARTAVLSISPIVLVVYPSRWRNVGVVPKP